MDATIDYTALIGAIFALLSAAGVAVKLAGRTKYVDAITQILDTMIDFATMGLMISAGLKDPAKADPAAIDAKGKEIIRQIQDIKACLGL